MSDHKAAARYNVQLNSPMSSDGSFFFERSLYGVPFFKKKITVALPLNDFFNACARTKYAAEQIKAVTGQTPNESQQPLYPWVATGMISKKEQIKRNTLSNDELVAAFMEADICFNTLNENQIKNHPAKEVQDFEKNYYVILNHMAERFGDEKLGAIVNKLHPYKTALVD